MPSLPRKMQEKVSKRRELVRCLMPALAIAPAFFLYQPLAAQTPVNSLPLTQSPSAPAASTQPTVQANTAAQANPFAQPLPRQVNSNGGGARIQPNWWMPEPAKATAAQPIAQTPASTRIVEPQPQAAGVFPSGKVEATLAGAPKANFTAANRAQASRTPAASAPQAQQLPATRAPQLQIAQAPADPSSLPPKPMAPGLPSRFPSFEKEKPPAFGPGSATFGQPFFHDPGVTPEIPVPVPPPPPAPTMGDAQVPALAGPATEPSTEAMEPQATEAASPVNELPKPSVPGPEAFAAPGNSTMLTEPTPDPNAGTPFERSGTSERAIEMIPPGSSGLDSQQTLPLAGTWKFNFHGARWEIVLKAFARHSNMSLQLEQFPTGEFTYYDDRMYSTPEALDVLNDYLIREGFLLVRNENKLTSISTKTSIRDGIIPFVPLRDVPILGRNELVSVAFPITGAGSPQVVAEVQQLLSPLGRVQLLSNSSRLIITDTGSSLRRMRDLLTGSGLAASEVSRIVIHLRNTQAEAVAQAINQRLGYSNGAAVGGEGVVQASAVSMNAGLGPIGIVAEASTNTLLIEGTPEELARFECMVQEIDRDPPQVMIQALLVEVSLGNTRETGVELGFQDSVLFDRSVVDNLVTLSQTNTSANGVQTTDQRIISQTAAPGFNFNGAPLGNNTSVNPSSVGKQGLSNLGVGRVNGDLGFGGLVLSAGSNSVNVLLRALAEKHKIDVLSRPTVRAIHLREALIQIGQQVPVVDGVTVTPNGSANPVVRQDRAGIILRVTPQISENGMVQIAVEAEKSAFRLAPGSGVPIFTDASNGNVIEAPVKDITTAQTTVAAMSGQTIVLGGMITREQVVVERKVPVLGDIPLIKYLFRFDLNQNERKELLIFLTPTVINVAGESDVIAAHEASRITLNVDPRIDLHRDFAHVFEQAENQNPADCEVELEMIDSEEEVVK